MDRAQKQRVVESLAQDLAGTACVVVTHQSVLSVADVTSLRRQVRDAGASFRVTKNRLAKRALTGTPFEPLSPLFTGPTAIAFSSDPVAAARVVVGYANRNDKLRIIGGGLAGLAAACALADSNFRVTLLERRPYLGGRASSYEHPGTGEVVDNCQHVLFRVCTNLVEFYRRIGVEDKIRWFDEMTFIEPGGRASVMRASPLPAPLHTAPSFLRFPFLDAKDKLAISRAIAALTLTSQPDTGLSAKFSMEFAMASGVIAKRVGLRELTDEFVQRPDIQAKTVSSPAPGLRPGSWQPRFPHCE